MGKALNPIYHLKHKKCEHRTIEFSKPTDEVNF